MTGLDLGVRRLRESLCSLGNGYRAANVFDTALPARRLTATAHWLRRQPEADGLAVGYFGASTGAAAALWAAGSDAGIGAVVSRGGRPDLAGPVSRRSALPRS